ncbi:DoxX family protein [Muricauda sp. CAU 1633]|uniref:DoxX family protein n=1 Tax=Allomuricauda sp. CAU 1633 TaxID=2816036 RepID=UPI001A8D33B8|nr:DoxX family protein [Muricauda sp. CAU 1633]MBO0324145.1 DoxX family protein [Muricauda sp. CAU 1633]
MNLKSISNLALKAVPAIILLQTLFFKFSAAPESVYIFETLGLEPVGRIGIGILELIAAILLFIPRTTWLGAVLGLGLMAGAIFSHLTQLGIVVQNDGGTLFILAVVTFIFCAILTWMHRHQIPILNKLFA